MDEQVQDSFELIELSEIKGIIRRRRWQFLVPAVRPLTWLVETARIFSTRVQALARVAGPKAFRHLLSERGLKGRAGEFVIPRRIAVRPGETEARTSPAEHETTREGATNGGTR